MMPGVGARSGSAVHRTLALGRIGYLDNVALADPTLGVLRRNIEQSGLWGPDRCSW